MTMIELRTKFEVYCKEQFDMSLKHFRMVPWEWTGKQRESKTYTNNVTEGMWKLWKKFFEEGLLD